MLPVAQNTALFSLIGTTYGGDGRTTTALPDLRDRVPMHPGRGPGLTQRRLGQRGGVRTVTLTEAQMPPHNHTGGFPGKRATLQPPTSDTPSGRAFLARPLPDGYHDIYGEPQDLVPGDEGVGGGQPHPNEQPYLVLNFIIALIGLYPSRS